MKRRELALLTAILCAGWCGNAAHAAEPPNLGSLPGVTQPTPQEREAIESYAVYFAQALSAAGEAANPDEIDRARKKLLDFRGPTAVFLNIYERAMAVELNRAIDSGNAHGAVSAIIVLSKIGTERALEQLTERADISREPRHYIRHAAARGAADVLGSVRLADLEFRVVRSALNDLERAAEAETDRYVLHYQLRAMLAPELQPPSTQPFNAEQLNQLRDSFANSLEKVAERAVGAANPGQARDLFVAASDVSEELLRLCVALVQAGQGAAVAPQLESALLDLLAVPAAHWQILRNDFAMAAATERVVNVAEQVLNLFHGARQNRPPGNMRNAWNADTLAEYQRVLNGWKTLLGG